MKAVTLFATCIIGLVGAGCMGDVDDYDELGEVQQEQQDAPKAVFIIRLNAAEQPGCDEGSGLKAAWVGLADQRLVGHETIKREGEDCPVPIHLNVFGEYWEWIVPNQVVNLCVSWEPLGQSPVPPGAGCFAGPVTGDKIQLDLDGDGKVDFVYDSRLL